MNQESTVFNNGLVQIELTPEAYSQRYDGYYQPGSQWFEDNSWMPQYTLALCPFCGKPYMEYLDTYSIKSWGIRTGLSLNGNVIQRCNHFVMVYPFFHFHGHFPQEARGLFTPEVPHVIGKILGDHVCAVLHALPICKVIDQKFTPAYNVIFISYFSNKDPVRERPMDIYERVLAMYSKNLESTVSFAFGEPTQKQSSWWNLITWVKSGHLYWVDVSKLDLSIKTFDAGSFPYGNIEGRKMPYFHQFPYSLRGK